MPKYHALELKGLKLWVRLGCSEAERSTPQEVRVRLKFKFALAPEGYLSDRLTDTICYAEVSNAIQNCVEAREYHLIERLAADTYAVAREIAGAEVAVKVSLHKVRPPLERLSGGSHYHCGDF